MDSMQEVQVEWMDGKKETAKVGKISRGDFKRIQKMMSPEKIEISTDGSHRVGGGNMVSSENLIDANDETVKAAIISPESLKKDVSQLTNESFEKLLKAANEENGVSATDEKKLEGASGETK